MAEVILHTAKIRSSPLNSVSSVQCVALFRSAVLFACLFVCVRMLYLCSRADHVNCYLAAESARNKQELHSLFNSCTVLAVIYCLYTNICTQLNYKFSINMKPPTRFSDKSPSSERCHYTGIQNINTSILYVQC
jgi:hypothetical protein